VSYLAFAGWPLAALLAVAVVTLQRRLELAACAEHELRGPIAALSLGVESLARDPLCARRARVLAAELDRIRTGLADLAEARRGRRAAPREVGFAVDRLAGALARSWDGLARPAGRHVRLDWRAGSLRVRADRGRLSQALSNLIANGLEHGRGSVEVRATRAGDRVRLEVRDQGPGLPGRSGRGLLPRAPEPPERAPSRGRGLGIAQRAAEDCGGRLVPLAPDEGAGAAIELPLRER
jgi:signal transduction histidine kinase